MKKCAMQYITKPLDNKNVSENSNMLFRSSQNVPLPAY